MFAQRTPVHYRALPTRRWLSPRALAAYLLTGVTALGSAGFSPVAAAPTTQPATATIAYPGPSVGVPATQHPAGSDFSTHCNAHSNLDVVRAGGVSIPVGAAIGASTGCGAAVLLLSVPGGGHFHANFAVTDADTSGKPEILRVRALGPDGYTVRTLDVTASKATGPQAIDLDISGTAGLSFDFIGTPQAVLYNSSLSGSARVLRPATGQGNTIPAGATPVSLAGASYACNAHAATDALSVSRVAIPAASGATLTACGIMTVHLPAGAGGTFALRYGSGDESTYNDFPDEVSLRVLDAGGHLLRKAVGISFLGGGLRPLWVSTRGGSTVTISVDGDTANRVAVTGLALLGQALAPHPNPDHLVFGGPPGVSVPIVPEALVSSCNAHSGSEDITVAHATVRTNTYINASDCGVSQTIMTNSHGRVQARFGVPDGAAPGKPAAVKLIVLDRNSHPLYQATVHASAGAPGTPIDVSIENASIITFLFTGTSVLYDLRLTGHAVVYDRVSPATDPPVSAPGGVAIDPSRFTRSCNAYLPDHDVLLIHQATLEYWALTGQECGSATLSLGSLPHNLFSARFGIPAADQTSPIATVQLSVLDAAGKVLRHAPFTARAGYGPQPLKISLAGGAKLQIDWVKGSMALFAMTGS